MSENTTEPTTDAPTTAPPGADDAPGNAPAVAAGDHGDHDRVVMLSLHPDGSPAQNRPEFIGDKDGALEATTEQFKQQAVSAVDVQLRGVSDDADSERDDEVLKAAHVDAEEKATDAAKSAVDSLHQGLGDTSS